MDNSVKDGGSAFPYTYWDVDSVGETVPRQVIPGMSIRDYFAAQALMGLCANPDISKHAAEMGYHTEDIRKDLAVAAIAMADAMIAEREKMR